MSRIHEQYRREIMDSARSLKIDIEEVNRAKRDIIWERLCSQYLEWPRPGWFWENLRDDVRESVESLYLGPEFLREASAIAPDSIVILIVDNHPDLIFMLPGAQLSALLSECLYFEIAVLNEEMTGMLCFNHHDYAIGVGEAADWLRAWQLRAG